MIISVIRPYFAGCQPTTEVTALHPENDFAFRNTHPWPRPGRVSAGDSLWRFIIFCGYLRCNQRISTCRGTSTHLSVIWYTSTDQRHNQMTTNGSGLMRIKVSEDRSIRFRRHCTVPRSRDLCHIIVLAWLSPLQLQRRQHGPSSAGPQSQLPQDNASAPPYPVSNS